MSSSFRHPLEPFRIKSVEAIPFLSAEQREAALREAGYNLFAIRAEDVTIDLLTDSGTGAMSDRQWSGLMRGDESYSGARNFYRLERAVRDLTGYEHVIPVHQGRAAEHLMFTTMLEKGDIVVSNTHFDTTGANVLYCGATPIDLPHPSCGDLDDPFPFKGNIDLDGLRRAIAHHGDRIKLCVLTITSNTVGGQPVSYENVCAARAILRENRIPLYFDAARFAENAWFVRQREESQNDRSVRAIARAVFDCGDGCLMSAKKDGLSNIGGFLALRDGDLAARIKDLMVVLEGFPTYGGLAGRDLEAIAIGLDEVCDESYLSYRTRQTEWFGQRLIDAGARVVVPIGGHAVFVDAGSLYPHIPPEGFPGQALAVAMYRDGGVRTVEIGSLMFGAADAVSGRDKPRPELVRFALPRRVYTESHLGHVVDTFANVHRRRDTARGFAIEYQSPYLRHFTARLREQTIQQRSLARL